MCAQIGIVGQIIRDDLIRMLAIIMFPGLKAALGDQHADFSVPRQAQTRHAVNVAAEVRLARNSHTHTMRAQIIA